MAENIQRLPVSRGQQMVFMSRRVLKERNNQPLSQKETATICNINRNVKKKKCPRRRLKFHVAELEKLSVDTKTTLAAFQDHFSELPQTSPDAEQTCSAGMVATADHLPAQAEAQQSQNACVTFPDQFSELHPLAEQSNNVVIAPEPLPCSSSLFEHTHATLSTLYDGDLPDHLMTSSGIDICSHGGNEVDHLPAQAEAQQLQNACVTFPDQFSELHPLAEQSNNVVIASEPLPCLSSVFEYTHAILYDDDDLPRHLMTSSSINIGSHGGNEIDHLPAQAGAQQSQNARVTFPDQFSELHPLAEQSNNVVIAPGPLPCSSSLFEHTHATLSTLYDGDLPDHLMTSSSIDIGSHGGNEVVASLSMSEHAAHESVDAVDASVSNSVSLSDSSVGEGVLTSVGADSLVHCHHMHAEGKKSRKRQRCVMNWSSVRRKFARQSGQQYVSKRGKLVEAKVPCKDEPLCRCKLQCGEQFSKEDRQAVFDGFYEMDVNAKNAYIFQSMKPCAPKVQMCQAKKHRSVTFKYYITVGAEVRRVCKKAYLQLHSLSKSKLAHIGKQVSMGLSAPRPDARGRHNSRPHRCTEEARKEVVEHIQMFPAESSHYSRTSNPNRKYLSSELSINKMYNLYKSWSTEKKVKAVSGRTYRDIFNKCFNLGFGNPKSDTCSTCDAGVNEDHKQRATEAFSAMKEDRMKAQGSSDVCYITFDMEKTLPLPKLSTSNAFYLRQIWVYNVGVHVVRGKENKAYFNIWLEDEAGRGCEEVGSSILAFLEASKISGGRLIAWSDSCAGQNKNFYMICLWQYLIATKRFAEIEHKFPETGHSFMDSDRDFAQVEKEVRLRQNIYSVDEYHNIMAQSQMKQRPHVTRMAAGFFNIKQLPAQLGLRNNSKDEGGRKIAFRDSVKWIRIVQLGQYEYKTSHRESEEWHLVDIRNNRRQNIDLSSLQLQLRESQKVPLKPSKAADIRKQLAFIPAPYAAYYEQVVSRSTVEESADDIVVENKSRSTVEHEQPSSRRSVRKRKAVMLDVHL